MNAPPSKARPPSPSPEGRRWSRPLLFALLVLVGVVVASWPLLPATLRGQPVGHPLSDLADHLQGAWWFGEELLAGRWPDRTTLTHVPEERPLWYVDPVGAVAMLLLRPVGVPASWNLLVLGQLLLAGFVGLWVGRDATGSWWAGLVAAAIAGPSPYALGLVHSGLSEYLGLAPVIAATWMLLRATGRDPRGRSPTAKQAILAGILVALSGWQAFYYAAFTGLFALCCLPGRGWAQRVRPVLGSLAVAAVGLLPPGLLMARSLMAPGAAVNRQTAPGWGGGGPLPGTDLLTWIRPGSYYFPDTPALGNPGILHVNYLGWVALFLAAVALLAARRDSGRATRDYARGVRRVALPAGLYGLLMLGPSLVVAGRQLQVPLPLAALYIGPSPLSLVHHPYRMAAVGMAVLAVLAALGSLQLSRRWRGLLAGLVLVETLALSPAPWPMATTALPPPDAWEDLPQGAVLDWPPDATVANRRYQLAQLHHQRPIPYGVNVFLPTSLAEDPLVGRVLRDLKDPGARARNRDVPARQDPRVPMAEGPSRLGQMGLGSLVVHRRRLSDREWRRTRATLNRALGEPLRSDDDTVVWRIPGEPIPAP